MLIEKEIRILHESLVAKKAKVERVQAERNRSLEELNILGVEIVKEEKRMGDIVDSSVRQQ